MLDRLRHELSSLASWMAALAVCVGSDWVLDAGGGVCNRVGWARRRVAVGNRQRSSKKRLHVWNVEPESQV